MNQSIWADPEPTADGPEQEESRDQGNGSGPSTTIGSDPTSSGLSGAASTFEPDTSAPPPPDTSSADVFGQTGAQQHDLFNDIVPVESMRLRSDDDLFSDDFTPAPQPVVEHVKPQTIRGSGEGGRGRDRGRGRGAREARGQQRQRELRPADTTQRENAMQQSQSDAPESAPTGPRKETPSAVRGDRQGTGGVRKPKLTEEELAEKMAKIQIKNASLTAAHARAEADAASFAQREQQAKQVSEQRKKEERRDRQQMMGEREKNRQRKLKAMEGREWDAEKQEDDFHKGGRFDKRGGFAGDKQDYSDGREYLYREPRGGSQGRGYGRGGGRGGRPSEPATVPRKEDFPALPATKGEGAEDASLDTSRVSGSTEPSGKSWADQVEAAPTT
ncbi:Hypothetical predicted protein [Lecanosticta acicola]|uniref:Uncharacterized protein n=1 Tax=Lecanosticta acicola TaxID=111012 RepID=A0AAI8Z2G8_9PEZI|nr:Hypothetical predicted protein [Lecanosticta acicola]